MQKEKADLDSLPVAVVEKTAFKTTVYLNGVKIDEWSFVRDIQMYWSSKLDTFLMTMKCKIAFALLKGVGDPCPHCNKIIDIGNWKKLIDEPGEEYGHGTTGQE